MCQDVRTKIIMLQREHLLLRIQESYFELCLYSDRAQSGCVYRSKYFTAAGALSRTAGAQRPTVAFNLILH